MVARAAELARDSHARTRHAAVLVKDGSMLGWGTNAVPFPGEDHCYCKVGDFGQHDRCRIHAEQRAITLAREGDGWRLLARTDEEALFGRGRPPQLLTVAVRQDGRRRTWAHVGASAGEQLRAARERIRASSWRLDPTQAPQPDDTVLRVLVKEQTFASGQRADRRVLVPDIYVDENEVVLTLFVKPRPGYQTGDRNPETPVRIALAEPLGTRQLIDGAVAQYSPWARPDRASSS